jgi:Ran GTPase-activating protein (RanGAP) involved in mRNA processing and transport
MIAESLKVKKTLEDLEIGNNLLNGEWALGFGNLLNLNTNLKYLQFGHSGEKYIESVFRSLKINTNLIQINFHKMNIYSENICALSENLKINNSLKHIGLTECELNSQAMESLVDALANNTYLESFDLSFNHIGSNGVKYICKALTENKFLKEIILDHNNICDDGAYDISLMLTKNQSLYKISLLKNQFSLDMIDMLVSTISSKKNFTEIEIFDDLSKYSYSQIQSLFELNKVPSILSVSSLQFNPNEMKSFCNFLKPVTNLSISKTNLNSKTLSSIGDLIIDNKNIEELNLKDNEINYLSLINGFSKVFKESKTLKELDLGWNKITELGIPIIVDGLKRNETLEELALNSNYIQDEGAELLSELLRVETSDNENVKEAGGVFIKSSNRKIKPNNFTDSDDICSESYDSIISSPKVNTKKLKNKKINNFEKNNSKPLEYCISKITDIEFLGKKALREEPSKSETQSDLYKLCENLKFDKLTTRLDLGNKDLDNSAALIIANMIKMNSNIREIYLNSNNITWKGGLAIIEALEVNQSLSILNLDDNKLGDAGAVALSKMISTNKTLTKVFLARNNISLEGLQEIFESKKKYDSQIEFIY